MTLGEWLADWLETSVKPSKRPNTYKTYKRIIDKKIGDGLKTKAIQITALDLERFYAEQRNQGYRRRPSLNITPCCTAH